MKRITSRQNSLVTQYRHVANGDDRSMVLLDGPHLIGEALEGGLTVHGALFTDDALDRPDIAALVKRLDAAGTELASVTTSVLAAASPVRTPSGIVGLATRPAEREDRLYAAGSPLLVIGCGLQDPGNVGAVVRVAEAGGASGFIAAGSCADPFGWKALRGSMGSALRLPIGVRADVDGAVDDARRRGYRIAAAVPRGGASLFASDLRGQVALLVGAEGLGLPSALVDAADLRLTVPMRAPVESMNAAVTTALIVYEALRQRQ